MPTSAPAAPQHTPVSSLRVAQAPAMATNPFVVMVWKDQRRDGRFQEKLSSLRT
jgi:hypothetical protein